MTFCEWLATGTPPTYLAVVVASVAAVFAYRSSNASRASAEAATKQLKRLEDEREKEQASTIALWMRVVRPLHYYQKYPEGPPVRREYVGAFDLFYALRNLSVMPVYDAFVYIETGAGDLYRVATANMVLPSGTDLKDAQSSFVGTGIAEGDIFRLGILFRDAQGFLWDRQPDGRLVRMTDAVNEAKRLDITSRGDNIEIDPQLRESDQQDLYKID